MRTLQTADDLLAEAIRCEAIFMSLPFGDPARGMYESDVEFFLEEAAQEERAGK